MMTIKCLRFVATGANPTRGTAILYLVEIGLWLHDVTFDAGRPPAELIQFTKSIATDGVTSITKELLSIPDATQHMTFVSSAVQAILEHLQGIVAEQAKAQQAADINIPEVPAHLAVQ
jgi:hypothetical protein